jgi:hypothetical protein
LALVNTWPTTLAGVIALLQHPDDFAAQKIAVDGLDPRHYHSDVEFLESFAGDDGDDVGDRPR